MVDETGAPIVGARVRIEPLAHVSHEYAAWLRAALARRPAPAVQSTKDGSFVLPLLPEHRRLGTGTEPPLVLVVEAEGYQPWRESLPFGLAGFQGTHAVLHRYVAADRFEVRVADPAPGTVLWVRRLGGLGMPEDASFHDVPADGRVTVLAPLVPTPLVRPDWRNTLALGHEVQLLAPGSSTPAALLDPDSHTLELRAAPHARGAVAVRDGAGHAIPHVRALYRLPDGSARWFPAADSHAARDDVLTLLAVGAAGFVTRSVPPDAETISLAARPADAILSLQVRDGDRARADAEAWLVPLAENAAAPPRGRSLARQVMVAEDGGLELTVADACTHALVVEATGCAPRIFEPQDLVASDRILRLDATPTASLLVKVVDTGARPLAGFDVRVPASAVLPQARAHLHHTDDTGTCRVDGLRPGSIEIVVVGDGTLGRAVAQLRPGDTGEVVVAPTGSHLRGVARDDRGQRVAFAPFAIDNRGASAPQKTRSHTDALGRIELPFQSHDRIVTFLDEVAARETLSPSRVAEIHTIPTRNAIVSLPADAEVLRAAYASATDTTTEHLRFAASRVYLSVPAHVVRVDLVLASGPPAVVLADELGEPGRCVTLSRCDIVRRIALRITDGAGKRVDGARVVPCFTPGVPKSFDANEAGPIELVDGVPEWRARDRAAHRLAVFHPGFLPKVVAVPAPEGRADEESLDIELTRGAPITIAAPPSAATHTTVRVTQGENLVLNALVRATRDADGAMVARLPCALPAGSYTLHVEHANEVRSVPVLVRGVEPMLVR